jgi:DeoR family transcriptional regulator of aga operon
MVLGELWLDTALIGVDAVSGQAGATCQHEGEAGINSLMVQRAERVMVVATGAKLGGRAFARICPASRIDVVVTDDSADPDAVTDLRAAGVTVEVI